MRLPHTFQVLAMTMGDAWNGRVRSSVGAGLVPARGFESSRGAPLWDFGHLVLFEVWDLSVKEGIPSRLEQEHWGLRPQTPTMIASSLRSSQ